MNISEAAAVQSLLDWVLALVASEHDQYADVVPDEELIRIIGVLADRSSTALGAGLQQGDAITAAMRMLGIEPAVVRPTEPAIHDVHLPDHDVAPNAGSAT